MSTINTDAIDNITAKLDGLTDYMDSLTADIQGTLNGATGSSQSIINAKVASFNNEVNDKLSKYRQDIISIFKEQYSFALEMIAPIEPLLNISISLDTVVSVVTSIIDILTKPYQPIIEFTTTVIPKVLELSAKLQEVASYSPNFDVPDGITMPQINISVQPITPGDIT